MDINDALETILEISRKSTELEQHLMLGDHRRLIITQNGTREFVSLNAPPRNHMIANRDSLIRACAKWAPNGVVFHGDSQITVVIDDNDEARNNFLVMRLDQTEKFSFIRNLTSKESYDQREFVNLLRHKLSGLVSTENVSIFRSIKFRNNDDGEAGVSHGGDSLGLKVDSQVSSGTGNAIPEELCVTVKVYQQFEWEKSIKMCVDVNAKERTFSLYPQPDEIAGAIALANENLNEWLVANLPNGMTVINGSFE